MRLANFHEEDLQVMMPSEGLTPREIDLLDGGAILGLRVTVSPLVDVPKLTIDLKVRHVRDDG